MQRFRSFAKRVLVCFIYSAASLWLLGAGSSSLQAQIDFYFSAPFVQQHPAAYLNSSTANFDNLIAGDSYSSIALTPGANGPMGNFTVASPSTGWVVAANQFGGAGGTGNFLLAQAGVAVAAPNTFTLTLSEASGYFGFWGASIDEFNEIVFLRNGNIVGIYQAPQLLNSNLLTPAHFGNPNPNFLGGNPTEPFAYLSFFATDENSKFDQLIFTQLNGGGFEVDNVAINLSTIGETDRLLAGTRVGFIPVPEPIGLIGLGTVCVGLLAWRRSQKKNRVSVRPSLQS